MRTVIILLSIMDIMSRVLFVVMTLLFVISTSRSTSIISRKIFIPEDTALDTVVASVSEYLENGASYSTGKNFKMLNQKLVTYRNKLTSKKKHHWFTLNTSNGNVILKTQLDREELCQKYARCTIRLQIYSKKPSQMIQLNVAITDVNEHHPVFPVSLIVLNISEETLDGNVISLDQYQATDRDSSINSSIKYFLSPNSIFELKQFKDETGASRLQIELLRKLDYEVKSFYALTLKAKDGGDPSHSSEIPLQVQVTDENDNAPIFSKQEYSIAFPEDLRSGQVITQVQASDKDSGPAGTINYFISGNNRDETSALFQINKRTGEITLTKQLDRESIDKVLIFIEARDLGNPSQIGRTRLVVYVSDVNDNPPTISVSYISSSRDNTVYLSESMSRHTYFAYVIAKDYDLDANGQVYMTMRAVIPSEETKANLETDVSDTFRLASDGFLVLNKELDVEKQSRYRITINATDGGIRARWSIKEIHVVVLDENDNAPTFDTDLINVSLLEGSEVGTRLMKVQATDADAANPAALMQKEDGTIAASTNGDITYSLDPGATGTFSIEPRTGVITLVSPLDREQVSVWMVTITATDDGYPTARRSTCRVRVTINDTNDNAPVFTNPLDNDNIVYATILRDDVITRIQAVDYDEGFNGKVRFVFLSVDHVQQASHVMPTLFLLDEATGDLRLNMSHSNLSESLGSHVVVVEARDFGFPQMNSKRRLNIVITDEVVLPNTIEHGQLKDGGIVQLNVVIVIVGSVVGLLVIISLVVTIIIIKRKKKKQNPSTEKNAATLAQKMLSSAPQQQHRYSSNLSKEESTEHIPKRKFYDKQFQMTCDSTNTDVTQLSRNDVVILRHHDARKGDAAPSRENSLHRRNTQPESNRGSVVHDGDSGRGESDAGATSPYGNLNRSSFGPHCTDQCIHYGHGDHCWMPNRRGSRSQSPSKFHEHENYVHSSSNAASPLRSEYHSRNVVRLSQPNSTKIYQPPTAAGMGLTSLYCKTLPTVFVTPSTLTDNMNYEAEDMSLIDGKRTNSSIESTVSTGYITESEVV